MEDKKEKDLKSIKPYLDKIKELIPAIESLSNDELRNKTLKFKEKIVTSVDEFQSKIEKLQNKINQTDNTTHREDLYLEIDELNKKSYEKEQEILDEILPEAFAVIRETARRFTQNTKIKVRVNDFDQKIAQVKDYVYIENEFSVWKNTWNAAGKDIVWDMVHYDVQFIGGIVLNSGKISEMATGEGKTLVATLPIYLNALTGRGVHLVTVNDYLSRRDSAWMAPLFEFHGLSIDCIDNHKPGSIERKNAYLADITYGTNNEFGFDYLRDNMANSSKDLVQRGLNFAIVDEVDSVLIDDARTPLIISGPVSQGYRQEYDILKPKVEKLIAIQKQELSKLFINAKTLIQNGDKKNGGFKLYQVFRGIPKYKPLIKFLSEEGIRALLQKIEGDYIANNNREMPKVLKDLYFIIDEKNNSIELTDKGIEFLSKDSKDRNLFILPDLSIKLLEIEKIGLTKKKEHEKKEEIYRDFSIKSERIHSINQLLKVYSLFEKDVEYVVMNDEVKIVDEQTGRIMEGRRYSDGLHQALEAKENVKIESATQTFATITLQNYFRMYNKLAGMTGTAETEAGEFWEIYKLDVVVIPTNQPIQRKDKEDLVFKTNREKFNAIIEEIIRLSREEKRPVLVGTTSIEVSEFLSRSLQLRKIPHNVLNAKLHNKEAEIIAKAGSLGVVTIATNMAGRGTDIKLNKEVKQLGGLAIIGTERHESRRVDRQLRGRAGRQGDFGSSQFYVSLEDNLMRLFGSDRIAKLMDRMGHKEGEVIQHSMITKSIERAQKKVEENNFGMRKRLLEYDDVLNKQREVIYKRRKNALSGERFNLDVVNMIYDTAQSIVTYNKSIDDFENFEFELIKYFTIDSPLFLEEEFKFNSNSELIEKVYKNAIQNYNKKKQKQIQILYPTIKNLSLNQVKLHKNILLFFTDGIKELAIIVDVQNAYKTKGISLWFEFEKEISLAIIDENWKNHLREMDELRKSVQTASYEQKDPLIIYKQESFNLFSQMIDLINKEIVRFLFKGELKQVEHTSIQGASKIKAYEEIKSQNKTTESRIQSRKKIGRNEVVKIVNIQTGETKSLKFKQAETFLLANTWILNDMT